MAPTLRNGVVRGGAKKQILPATQKFCKCKECAAFWEVDRGSNRLVVGRYLEVTEWNRHRSRELREEKVLAHFALIPLDLTPPAMMFPTVPDLSSISPPTLPIPLAASPTTDSETLDPPTDLGGGDTSIPIVHSRKTKSGVKTIKTIDFITPKLRKIQASLKSPSAKEIRVLVTESPLVFEVPPTASTATNAPYVLDPDAPPNLTLIGREGWLEESRRFIEDNVRKIPRAKVGLRVLSVTLLRQVNSELAVLREEIRLDWERQRAASDRAGQDAIDTRPYLLRPFLNMDPTILACFLIVTVLHLFCKVSLDQSMFLLDGLRLLLNIVTVPSFQSKAVEASIPHDLRTVLSSMNLEPVYKTFVCCPRCFATYDASRPYPDHCTNRTARESKVCARALRKVRRRGEVGIDVPVREYLYQDLKDWVGKLYSRSGLEEVLDRDLLTGNPDLMSDINDATTLRTFCGPDGKIFLKAPGTEGRLIFSLNMDGFNPLMNKTAGKKNSTGGMYMVCLNLPPSLWYKVQNMFLVGIIPGPHEPSLQEINHLLKPLVDDLLGLWRRGVYLMQTPAHPLGRRVRCALVPLVCDLPAARQMAGFGAFSSTHFCSECKQDLDHMDDLDCKSWEKRTAPDHRAAAQAWKDAATENEQAKQFKANNGVRWSELLRLPYWDPTKFVVIDSMHCFYLGLFRRHVWEIWGMSVEFEDGEGISYENKNMPGEREMKAAWVTLRTESTSALRKLRRDVVKELCRDAGLRFSGTQPQLANRLIAYRVEQGWFNKHGDLTSRLPSDPLNERGDEGVPRPTDPQPTNAPTLNPDPQQAEVNSRSFNTPTSPTVPNTVNLPPDPPTAPPGSSLHNTSVPILGSQSPSVNTSPALTAVQESEEETAANVYKVASKTVLGKTKKSMLVAMCVLRGPDKARDFYQSMTGESLRLKIQNWRKLDGIIDANEKLVKTQSIPKSGATAPPLSAPPPSLVSTESEEEAAKRLYASASESVLKRTRKAILATMCLIRLRRGSEKTKQEYMAIGADLMLDELRESRKTDGIVDSNGKIVKKKVEKPKKTKETFIDKPKKRPKTRVLGRETLDEIRKDMADLRLPGWFSRAPSHPGESRWGKFYADQWKAFCTVNLVRTLIRLWGSKPKDSREYRMLCNFMHLVTAVKLATMNKMTEERILQYEHHMHMYLQTLLELYPGTSIGVYQHMALHFGDQLRRFGPTHSWCCFPFERYNYLLQKIPTNKIFGAYGCYRCSKLALTGEFTGEMEKTMFKRFTMGQTLRTRFENQSLPPELHPLITSYEKTFETDIRGTFINDDLAFDDTFSMQQETRSWKPTQESNLDNGSFNLLKQWIQNNDPDYRPGTAIRRTVYFRKKIGRLGQDFQLRSASIGDSTVVFAHPEDAGRLSVGSIASIFSHSRHTTSEVEKTQTFLAVKEYSALSAEHAILDHYRDFPEAGGRLFYRQFNTNPILLPITDVQCHAAFSDEVVHEINKDVMYVLPLNKE